MSAHLKLHSFTGTSDHDFTGLVSDQIIKYNGTNVESSTDISSLYVTNLSGGTILSGGTDLYDIFSTGGGETLAETLAIGNASGAYDIDFDDDQGISWNGAGETIVYDSIAGTIAINAVDGTDFETGAIYSAGTDLYNIFVTSGDAGDITRVVGGTNILTGGTDNLPIINLDSDIILTSVNATTLSGGTIYSAGTDLYDIFSTSEGLDSYVTGTTFSNSTYDLTLKLNNGLPDIVESLAVLASDVFVVSGVYNVATGIVTYTNSTGGTFDVSGFTTGMTDSFTTGATLVGKEVRFDNNIYGSNYFNVDLSSFDTSASNGLTKSGDNITLGGALSADTLIDNSGFLLTMGGDVIVSGDFEVKGTTTTIDTQTLRTSDNNIEMNLSGNNASANGGGITVLSGVSNSVDATWEIDSTGNWAANAGIQGTTVTATEFFAMTPYTGVVSANNNDAWFHSGATGTITLNYKVGGVEYSVELG